MTGEAMKTPPKRTLPYNAVIKKIESYERIVEKGAEFVKVPLGDVEALTEQMEESQDIRAYDRAKMEGGEGFPQDVMRRIVHGEHPMQVIREWRGLTQAALAKALDSKSAYISQIETGNREGSLSFMARVAEVLDVKLDDLVV
jgi:DNA-binding XRE family transcriptional regulator